MFSVDPYLLECWVVENVCGTIVVDQDSVCVIVSYSDANDECVIMWVVKTSSIFFWETNNWVIDPWYLRDDAYHLNILNHSKVGLSGLLGWAGGCCASHNHPYVSQGWFGTLVVPSGGLLLGRQICSLPVDELLQLPLPNKGFDLLL